MSRHPAEDVQTDSSDITGTTSGQTQSRGTAALLKRILTREDYSRFIVILVAMLLTALLQVTGIASILPFMQLVAKPDSIDQNEWLQWAYVTGGFTSEREMLLALGIAVFVLFSLSVIATALTGWLIARAAWTTAHRLSVRQIRIYMRTPYAFFLVNNSSALLRRIVADINSFIGDVLLAGSRLLAQGTVAIGLFILLLLVDPWVTLVAFLGFGGVYLAIHHFRHRYLVKLARNRIASDEHRYTSFIDAITGMKAIRSSGASDFFVNRFAAASDAYAKIYPRLELATRLPQQFMEILAFGGILGLVIYLVAVERNFADAIPMLSVFALATYRLMPALHTVFVSAASLSNSIPVIESLARDLDSGYPLEPAEPPAGQSVAFEHGIHLRGISFAYESAETNIVNDIDMQIRKGEWVALVGATGSGKSTLIDILAGLLYPTNGHLLVDGQAITPSQILSWRRHIAYVQQDVFLYDDTIARNISFGNEEIDVERLHAAARAAQIEEFIVKELDDGFATLIGERGVRLSGGQRQRIGIARAIYRQPRLLLLDEATSALDNVTEAALIDALRTAVPDMTVIMIAHRLSTVRFCDRIFTIERGTISSEGDYDTLIQISPAFRQMVEASRSENGETATGSTRD